MSHRCVHCGEIYPAGSKEILAGCSKCGGHFFFYVKEEQLEEIRKMPAEIPTLEKKQVEKQIREMAGIMNEETPVILDLESVRVVGSGKFELDIVNLFNKKRPLIYKLEEGKYIIDLASTFGQIGKEKGKDKSFLEISMEEEKKEKSKKKEKKEKEYDPDNDEEIVDVKDLYKDKQAGKNKIYKGKLIL